MGGRTLLGELGVIFPQTLRSAHESNIKLLVELSQFHVMTSTNTLVSFDVELFFPWELLTVIIKLPG